MSTSPKLQIDAVQSVVPIKPTDPTRSVRVVTRAAGQSQSSTIFNRRFHVVMCYNKASDSDSGWVAAGWIKESLGRSLSQLPLLAGRLRRRQQQQPADDDDEHLQIVSNDSGSRLVEARIDMNLADFLDLKDKKVVETNLVFWEDTLRQNPQFFPLFYVQVTNFKCGGYSIGISSSLVVSDPFVLTSFLKKWADVHKSLIPKPDAPKMPTFYLPKINNHNSTESPSSPTASQSSKCIAQSVILNADTHVYHNLAAQCIDEAERKIGTKMASNFSLFVKKPNEDVEIEICSREGTTSTGTPITIANCSNSWSVLGADEICFNEGNKVAYVSCWINSIDDEGSVMIVESDNAIANTFGTKIIVTFTA